MTDWIPFFVAGTATVVLLTVLLRWQDKLPMDRPNERSLHQRPTPRIGGLAVFPAAVLGWAVESPGSDEYLLLIGLAAFLFMLSILDDWRGLTIALRLTAHLLAAVLLALGLIGVSPLAVLVALTIVWMTNLFNFMDGANGLAGGMAMIGFSTLGLASGDAALAFALAGATAGFLTFNFDPARVFLGDAGSIPLGFLAGCLGLFGVINGQWPWWFPLLTFAPFFVDATVTLLRRIARMEKFWVPHREHYYQRLVRMGWSHRQLAASEYALMVACGASSLVMKSMRLEYQMLGLSIWIVIYAILMRLIDRVWIDFNSHGKDRA